MPFLAPFPTLTPPSPFCILRVRWYIAISFRVILLPWYKVMWEYGHLRALGRPDSCFFPLFPLSVFPGKSLLSDIPEPSVITLNFTHHCGFKVFVSQTGGILERRLGCTLPGLAGTQACSSLQPSSGCLSSCMESPLWITAKSGMGNPWGSFLWQFAL